MTVILPDSNAFALAQRNLSLLPPEIQPAWQRSILAGRSLQDLPWPERVIIELANTCNLDCPMCRVGAHGADLRRIMPLEDFRRLLLRLATISVRDIRLNGLGESTLVPGFDAYLDLLAGQEVTVELITNGTAPPRVYRRMVDDGATLLFSWDAAEPALFEKLRRGARWARCLEILTAVARYARDAGREDLVHLIFTMQAGNVDQLPPLVELAAARGIAHVLVNMVKLPDDGWQQRKQRQVRESFRAAHEVASARGVSLYLPESAAGEGCALPSVCRTSATGCDRPWRELVVRWDQEVQVCNMFNPYSYGNLRLHSLEHAWRGPFARAFRDAVNTTNQHPYCRGCCYIGDVYEKKNT